jgi:beta-lactamase class D
MISQAEGAGDRSKNLFGSGEDGCLVTIDLKTDKSKSLGSNCSRRTPPCSTFKIALAELGLNTGNLSSTEQFRWDGVVRGRVALNRDHNLKSWLADSVVWVSSILAGRFGLSAIGEQLKKVKYGNAIVTPGEFWLDGSLQISAVENANFLARPENEFLSSAISMLPVEKFGAFAVSGKTGSCYMNGTEKHQIGWYVGWAKSDNKSLAFAVRFIEKGSYKTKGPAGFRTKEIAKEYFKSLD